MENFFTIRNGRVSGLQEKMGVTISQEAYDALSDEKKNDGTIYFIPDGDGEIGIQDTIVSENSVWSSQKVSDEIAEVETELNANVTALSDRVKTVEDDYAKKDIKTMTYTFSFGDVTWQESALGKFYNVIELPNVSKILSVSLGDFEFLTPDEIIQPFILSDKQMGIMSNTAKSNGKIRIYITYI